MSEYAARAAVEAVFRIERAKLLGALVRLVRDVGLAEELCQEALLAAFSDWPRSGVPEKPAAWLMTTSRRRALDRLRRAPMVARSHTEIGRATLASLALAIFALRRRKAPGSMLVLAGCARFLVRTFAVTAAFNVPMNDELAALDPASPTMAELWPRYLADWTAWNHVRTVASTLAMGCFVAALARRDS